MRQELGSNLLLHIDWHVSLEQVVDDEVRMLVLRRNLDRKQPSLPVDGSCKLLSGKQGKNNVSMARMCKLTGTIL